MHILFYRPLESSKAWTIHAAYDSAEDAFEAAANMIEGGPYEFRYAFLDPMKIWVADKAVWDELREKGEL